MRFRVYGLHAFAKRGYYLVLLRDATTAVEGPEAIEKETMTWHAIRNLEMSHYAFTMTTDHFNAACHAAVAVPAAGTESE